MWAPRTITALLVTAAAVFGCGDPSPKQLYSPPPWPDSHTVVLTWLSEAGEVVQAPEVFEPGQAVSVDVPKDADRLLVLTYEDARGDLLRCKATLGGARPLLPTPDTVFETGTLSNEGTLALTPRPTAPPLELRYAECTPDPEPGCPTLKLTTYTVPDANNRDLHAITAFAGRVLVSPTAGSGPVVHQLYQVLGEAVQPVALPQPVGNSAEGLRALTADATSIWGAQGRTAYQLNENYEVHSSSVAPFFVQRLIAEGDGGPVLATADSEGVGGVFDVTGQLAAIDEPSDGAVLAGPDRRFVLLNGAIMRWQSGAWVVAHRFDTNESYLVLGGNRQTMAAASVAGELLVREETDPTWRRLPAEPTFGTKLRVVLPIGQGGLLVAGNDGFIGFWHAGRWCAPPARAFTNTVLSGVVHEGAAYLGTGHISTLQGDSPIVVKVEIVD